MNFPKTITIEACERFLDKLQDRAEIPLVLPIGTSSLAFSGLASAIQVVNTWARHSDSRALVLKEGSGGIDESIRDTVAKIHKFVAAMYAKEITSSLSSGNDLRATIYKHAKEAVELQEKQPYGQQRGPLCWFGFVDHSSKGFDPHFYIAHGNDQPRLRSAEQIESVISSMIGKSTQISGGGRPLSEDQSSSLGRIFYELFLNTHEHGTRGKVRSEWLRPGTRILYVNAINLNESAFEKMTDEQPPLRQYLSSRVGARKARYIEIGVVDSGLGYCDRWRADKNQNLDDFIGINEEYNIFKDCFKFRQTSTLLNIKGNGLPAVMDRLTKLKGFIRIRSGRLALYRDFVEYPFGVDDQCHFSDWKTQESAEDSLSMLSKVSGVAISILVPLEDKQ